MDTAIFMWRLDEGESVAVHKINGLFSRLAWVILHKRQLDISFLIPCCVIACMSEPKF